MSGMLLELFLYVTLLFSKDMLYPYVYSSISELEIIKEVEQALIETDFKEVETTFLKILRNHRNQYKSNMNDLYYLIIGKNGLEIIANSFYLKYKDTDMLIHVPKLKEIINNTDNNLIQNVLIE